MMGARGPAPLPANVHRINNNPSNLRGDELAARELQVEPGIPPKPDYLFDAAGDEWDRITPLLRDLGLLSQLDLAAIAAYCQSYAVWSGSQRVLKDLGIKGFIDRTPNGMRIMSVTMQIANRAEESMRRSLIDFGLSPAARTRLRMTSPQGDLFGDDPMAKLIQAGTPPAA